MDQHSFPLNSRVRVPLDLAIGRTSRQGVSGSPGQPQIDPLQLTMWRKEGTEGLFHYFSDSLNEASDLSSGGTD